MEEEKKEDNKMRKKEFLSSEPYILNEVNINVSQKQTLINRVSKSIEAKERKVIWIDEQTFFYHIQRRH